jgi:hypothetical protein
MAVPNWTSKAEELKRISRQTLCHFNPDLAAKALVCVCGRIVRGEFPDSWKDKCTHVCDEIAACCRDWPIGKTAKCRLCQTMADCIQLTDSQFKAVYCEKTVDGWAEVWQCLDCNHCMAISYMPNGMMRDQLVVKMRKAHVLVCSQLASGRMTS